jgi:hypothetical protein
MIVTHELLQIYKCYVKCTVIVIIFVVVIINILIVFVLPLLRRLVANSTPQGLGSVPVRSICYLWWTEWHWKGVFSEYLGFPL